MFVIPAFLVITAPLFSSASFHMANLSTRPMAGRVAHWKERGFCFSANRAEVYHSGASGFVDLGGAPFGFKL
jgi:hypothetical protein